MKFCLSGQTLHQMSGETWPLATSCWACTLRRTVLLRKVRVVGVGRKQFGEGVDRPCLLAVKVYGLLMSHVFLHSPQRSNAEQATLSFSS